MPLVGSKKPAKNAGKKAGTVAKLPKKRCCVDTPKCGRCPLRMQLVKVDVKTGRKSGTKAA